MFLLQTVFDILGLLFRLPRGLLLGLVLFVLGLVLLELVHPSPRNVAQHAAVAQLRAPPVGTSHVARKAHGRRAQASAAVASGATAEGH